MNFDLKHKLLAGFAVVFVLGLAFLGYQYVQSKVAQAKMEATIDAQKAVQAEYQKQFSDLAKMMAERDIAYRQQIDLLDKKYTQAVTPQQIATLVSQVMGLKQPVTLVTPPATISNPNPVPVAQISTLDAPQVKAYVQDCETCKLERDKIRLDLADRQKQQELAQKQIESLKQQRDSAVTAAKGGTWIKRGLKGLKVAACAGGGAAAGASKGSGGAAIGAVGGAVVCSLL